MLASRDPAMIYITGRKEAAPQQTLSDLRSTYTKAKLVLAPGIPPRRAHGPRRSNCALDPHDAPPGKLALGVALPLAHNPKNARVVLRLSRTIPQAGPWRQDKSQARAPISRDPDAVVGPRPSSTGLVTNLGSLNRMIVYAGNINRSLEDPKANLIQMWTAGVSEDKAKQGGGR
ncbi:hypothetical protein VP1G_10975 [Cytospora mali]|uniref:Uncharacterized protein n=1 Tax=Cytospora mali TaxID=578113 RepID=A0A194V1G7_CYTMA|nr:hypothetical protein VP1G_10975 [Valsa mali var. pyri (nom. inval.)]